MTESPTKLKQRAKAFLKMLEKHNIRLDINGDVDYRKCEDENVVQALKKKE